MSIDITRRQMLRASAAAGFAGALELSTDSLLRNALAAAPKCGRLKDIEHVVILMQENRSFDHYFGTYPGARGFGEKGAARVLTQSGYPAAGFGGKLTAFHLDSKKANTQCFGDITHEWGAQHRAWNRG